MTADRAAAPSVVSSRGRGDLPRLGGPDRRALPHAVTDPRTGDVLELRRAWPREPGCLHAEFTTPTAALVAAQWFADRQQLEERAAATPGPTFVVPGTGVLLQPDGVDRRLRALATVVASPGTVLVAHRPERRAVLRRRAPGPDGTPVTTYLKILRGGKTAAVVSAAERVARAADGAFAVPRLLRQDDAVGLLEWSELPGRTLQDLGADPALSDQAFAGAWRRVGVAVAALHAGGPTGASPGGAEEAAARHDTARHDAAAEAEQTRRWLDAAGRHGLLPALDVERLLADLLSGPPGPEGLLHRDLHDKQLVLDPDGGVGLLDADTAAVGERAVDLANLLGHLELRRAQGLLSVRRAAIAREELLAGAGAQPQTLARVPAYARATRLRLAGLYAFRPRWRAAAVAMLRAGTRG